MKPQSSEAGCQPTPSKYPRHCLNNLTDALRKGVKAPLPSTQTQGGCQSEETKKYGPNEGTGENPRKTDVEIAILSYAVFKTLVVRMPKDLVEYSKSIREEMKATLREIKKNTQETNSKGKEARIQINDLEHKEKISIQSEQQEEKY